MGDPASDSLLAVGDQQMSATLKLTHKAIGAEVRRGTYDVVVDGEQVGSVEMNHTIEIPVEPGRHTLQVRDGRNSSSTQTFDAAEKETVAFRCTGKRLLPIFLASFVVPGLALKLVRD
jgi:Penicillin-Binding Protein C-terminus Family